MSNLHSEISKTRQSARGRLRYMEKNGYIKDWDYTQGEDIHFITLRNDIEVEMTSEQVFHFFLGVVSAFPTDDNDRTDFLNTSMRGINIVIDDEYAYDDVSVSAN